MDYHQDERLDQTQDDPDFVEHACCECGSHAHICTECPTFLENVEREAVLREVVLEAEDAQLEKGDDFFKTLEAIAPLFPAEDDDQDETEEDVS